MAPPITVDIIALLLRPYPAHAKRARSRPRRLRKYLPSQRPTSRPFTAETEASNVFTSITPEGAGAPALSDHPSDEEALWSRCRLRLRAAITTAPAPSAMAA